MSLRFGIRAGLAISLGLGPAPVVLLGSALTAPPQEVVRAAQVADDPVALRETEDPADIIHAAILKDGKVEGYRAEPLSKDAFSMRSFPRRKARGPRDRPSAKIHPLLSRWLKERRPDEVEQIVVTFQDDTRIPRFPEPAVGEPRDSPLNRKALGRAEELVRELEGRRGETYARRTEEMKTRYQGEVLETFWLVSALLAQMPLRAVPVLAKREDVLYLEPRFTLDQPPQNANNNDDVDDGRARINSDPYFNLGLTGGFIGLLDSGMRFTHTVFNNPSHIDFRRDCVNGGATCNTGTNLNPNDDCWNHGTSSGAIITANANQGAAFRGVTGITLDSFKIYPTRFDANNLCNGNLDTAAMVRGFQRAVAVLDRIIVGEAQGSGNHLSSISIAADNAFDAGAVVIAANGNNGPNASTVNAPASAHKAIGTGNFDVQTQAAIASQSRGATADNRIKPDIQAPTNTETASNGCAWQQNCTTGGSDTAFRVFGGTSGSTPYASGAAALLRNWLRGTSSSIDPGQVYAQLILSGQTPAFNNTTGAGRLRLPTNGHAWWGKVNVSNGQTIDIPLGVSGVPNTLDGALWWPETASQTHNDVDLSLIDSAGTLRASSLSIPSVFERARASGTVPNGTWKLRIRGYNVTGSQPVYWAVAAHRR